MQGQRCCLPEDAIECNSWPLQKCEQRSAAHTYKECWAAGEGYSNSGKFTFLHLQHGCSLTCGNVVYMSMNYPHLSVSLETDK